jgi:hypothetical protein
MLRWQESYGLDDPARESDESGSKVIAEQIIRGGKPARYNGCSRA